MNKKTEIEKGYETGRNGLYFWTTDYVLFENMKKIILDDAINTLKQHE